MINNLDYTYISIESVKDPVLDYIYPGSDYDGDYGNCGNYAFALASILIKDGIVKEKDITFAITLSSDEKAKNFDYKGKHVHHILLKIGSIYYDGTGKHKRMYLDRYSQKYCDDTTPKVEEYRYNDPEFISIVKKDTHPHTRVSSIIKRMREFKSKNKIKVKGK